MKKSVTVTEIINFPKGLFFIVAPCIRECPLKRNALKFCRSFSLLWICCTACYTTNRNAFNKSTTNRTHWVWAFALRTNRRSCERLFTPVLVCTGDQNAGDRRGVVRVLLAAAADLQPPVRDLSSDQHVSSSEWWQACRHHIDSACVRYAISCISKPTQQQQQQRQRQ